MNNSLKNKWALILGASSGFGEAVSIELANAIQAGVTETPALKKIPGNFNIYFGFLSPKYVTFTIANNISDG